MALTKQIHLYALDTACFYNDIEMELHKKLSKCYSIRSRIKKNNKKCLKTKKTKSKHYDSQIKRINKIIAYLKEKLYNEFIETRKTTPIRNLREESIIDRNVISIFESALTRALRIQTNELTQDLMVIKVFYFQVAEDLIKRGFMYKDEKYVLFSASAGQIRTKKFVVIKESTLKNYENTLTCGLSWDIINLKGGVNANKYLAYYSLNNSATDIWEGFDIDKSIVVEDFETLVYGTVDFISDVTYEIERKTMDIPIPHTDGAGIMLDGDNEMVRLPWVKGLMGVFAYDELILEWRETYNNPKIGVIKDIYGVEHDVIAEDVRYIFTKSQFKMWKYYESWEQYKDNFKKYKCQACICNTEEEYIPDAQINYQMLQSLSDIKYSEMERLAKRTVEDINNIGNDYRTMMKILGVTKYNTNKNYMQQALEIYPELMRDKYNRQILKDCRDSIIKEGRAGKLSIKGKYTFVLPDLYAFCEWLFLGIENPNGLLNNGEVSCSIYKNGVDLDCLRSPHLYREHAVRTNIINDNTKKWFRGKAIYTSTRDLISKYLMFDVDGDKLLIVADKLLCRIAKRNMKDIVPLYYDMKKAPNQNIDNEILFNGLISAYKGGNIGLYSNNISKIWNCDKVGQEQIDVIKLLCMENNFVIDMAKTLYMPTRPKDKDKLIKEYAKLQLPHFFIYAKDKEEDSVNEVNDSPMNMLDKMIGDKKLLVNKSIGKLDYKMLMSNMDYIPTKDTEIVMRAYDYWNNVKAYYFNVNDDKHRSTEDLYVYQKIRKYLLKLPYDNNFIVDSIIYTLFNNRKSSYKKTFWGCFGKEVVENLKTNTQSLGKICPICGKRFKPRGNANSTYCNDKCMKISDKEMARKRMQNLRQ